MTTKSILKNHMVCTMLNFLGKEKTAVLKYLMKDLEKSYKI